MAGIYGNVIERVGDMNRGLLVETSVLDAGTYLVTGGVQTNLFNIKGRVLINYLWLEVIADLSAQACQALFAVQFTTPVIAVNAMCAKCASLSGAVAGVRAWFVGGAVATAAVITDSAGLSDIAVTPHMVGGKDFVGTLAIVTSDASIVSGTFQVGVCYSPMSIGAYIESRL